MTTAHRLYALNAPKIATPRSLVLPGGGEELHTMPCGAFLIEHDRGLVLVDAMLDPEGRTDLAARYPGLEWLFAEYTEDQTVEANLRALGRTPADVTHVVVSHLHFDHAGSFGLFPHAKFYIGRGEMTHASRPPIADPFYALRDVTPLEGMTRFEVGQDHDLFDDGAITLIHAPGHTVGQLAVLVRLPSQNVLLACDVVHDIEAFHAEVSMIADFDGVAAVESIRRCKLIADGTSAKVIISHFVDPDVPILPEFLA